MKIRRAFMTGIAAILPIFLTGFVVVRLFTSIDSWLQPSIELYFGREIIGLGFLIVLLLVFFVGIITNTFVARKITGFVDWVFTRIPFIKQIYITMRGLASFSRPNEQSFKKVVMVEFPSEGIQSMGFITKEEIRDEQQEMVSVFIPTTPNPTNGFLIYVEPSKVKVLDLPVEEGIRAIVSMGTLTPRVLVEKEDKK
jgi:uncharacterized membrane protein